MSTEELWYVRGNKPVLWTIPVYVTWPEENRAELFPAVTLLKIQERAFKSLMADHGHHANGIWSIRRRDLQRIAELTVGGDPELLLSWERIRLAQLPKNKRDVRPERAEFLDAFYQSGFGSSRDEVEFWWNQFCTLAFDWMVNKERPVDMYFIKLHLIPYRVNWKERLWESFTLHHLRAEGGIKRLQKIKRFYQELRHPRLLSMSNAGIIHRTIEVEHLPQWWILSKQVESKRLSQLNPIRYAESIAESVSRATAVVTRLYTAWVARKAQRFATLVPGHRAGTFSFKSDLPPKRKPSSRNWATRSFAKTFRNARKKHGKPRDIPRAPTGVPALPAVEPPAQDVRDGRPDVRQPTDAPP